MSNENNYILLSRRTLDWHHKEYVRLLTTMYKVVEELFEWGKSSDGLSRIVLEYSQEAESYLSDTGYEISVKKSKPKLK